MVTVGGLSTVCLVGCSADGPRNPSKALQPRPAGLGAAETWPATPLVFTLFAFASGLGLLVYCLCALRRKDSTPLLLWTGGLLAGFVAEPLLDLLGHLWWPQGYPVPYYAAGGILIPLLVPAAYAAYTGMTAYLGLRLFQRGLTTRQVMGLWTAFIAVDAAMQAPGALLGAYVYYGGQGLQLGGFPFLTSVKNGTAYLLTAFVVWIVMPALKGWVKIVFLLLIPLTGYLAGAVAAGWPRYIEISTEMPVVAAAALTVFSLGLNFLFARGIAVLTATDSGWKFELVRRTSNDLRPIDIATNSAPQRAKRRQTAR